MAGYDPRSFPPGTWLGGRPTPGATALLIVVGAIFLTYVFLHDYAAGRFVAQHLALRPRLGLGAEPWQLVTSGLVHLRFSPLLGSAIGLWIFGSAIELVAGRRRLLAIFVAAQLAGTLVLAGIGRLLTPELTYAGCDPGVIGLLGAFAVYYGPRRLSLFGAVDLSGRVVAWLFLGLSLLVRLLQGDWAGLGGAITAAGVGLLLAGGTGERLAILWDRLRLHRLRRKYRVIDGGKSGARWVN